MSKPDREAQKRLEHVLGALRNSGLLEVVQVSAGETWRANRERYEPDGLFDDTSTLGYQTSKNLANRLADSLGSHRSLAAEGVSAAMEANSLVIRVEDVEIRLVKAPVAAGRSLNLSGDFDWQGRETRLAAARRNADAYRIPVVVSGHEPMFDLPQPGADAAAAACRDFFIVWAGDMNTGLTAGWLGLPTSEPGRWLAIERIWWDDLGDAEPEASSGGIPGDGTPFTERPSAVPAVRLKGDNARESMS